MAIERPGDSGRKNEVIVADPENPDALGLRVEVIEENEPVYRMRTHEVGGIEYQVGEPNTRTERQRYKSEFARHSLGSQQPINVKYYGRPDRILAIEPGMRIVVGEIATQFVEFIDDIDDQPGVRSPEKWDSYKTLYPNSQVDENDRSDCERIIGIFSPVDGRDKFSEKARDCIQIAGFGEKSTDYRAQTELVSFLGHINIKHFLESQYEAAFEEIVRLTVRDLREKCFDGSYRLVVACGQVRDPQQALRYWHALKKLGGIIKDELGIYPQILVAPNIDKRLYDQHVYARTHEGRLIVCQPRQVSRHEWHEPLSMTFEEYEESLPKGEVRYP